MFRTIARLRESGYTGSRSVKYVAELAHVREGSLLGSADFGFWAERLRGEGLTPVEHAGRARVLVVACDSKFFGVRFRGTEALPSQ